MVLCQFDHGSGLCSQVWRFDSDGAIKLVAVILTFLFPMAKIYGLRTNLVRVSTVRGLSKALPAERWLETWDAAGRLASRAQLPCTPVVSDSERAAYTARLFHFS